MESTILDLESVCSDADLAARGGGAALLSRARPASVSDFATVRNIALLEVLDNLAARTPPIYDSDLANPAELRGAVAYRSLTMIAQQAITADGDAWSVRMRQWRTDAADALRTLRPTLSGGMVGPPMGIKLSRR